MRTKTNPTPDGPGSILPGEILPLPTLKQRLGWGNKTVAQAQRDGLKMIRYGKWKVTTAEYLRAFFEKLADGNGDQEAHP